MTKPVPVRNTPTNHEYSACALNRISSPAYLKIRKQLREDSVLGMRSGQKELKLGVWKRRRE